MKNTPNKLLVPSLSVALGVGAAVSGVTLWTLMSQDVVRADNCTGSCTFGDAGNATCAYQDGNNSNCVCVSNTCQLSTVSS